VCLLVMYVKVLLVVVVVMHGLVWRVSGVVCAGCEGVNRCEQSGILMCLEVMQLCMWLWVLRQCVY